MLAQVEGVHCFVSAITATQTTRSSKVEGTQYMVKPGMGYWLMGDPQTLQDRVVYSHLQSNPYGASMKPLLHPYQNSQFDIGNALFTVVKDNVEGLVTRAVNKDKPNENPIVKIHAFKNEEWDNLQQLVKELNSQNFHSVLQEL